MATARQWGGAFLFLLIQPGVLCLAQGTPARVTVSGPWTGIYPTVLTPFGPEGVDTNALKRQIELQVRGGVHGLLVLETIGEGRYVTGPERAQVIGTAVQTAGGKVPVIVGIHGSHFMDARDQLLEARQLGAAAVLVQFAGKPADAVRFHAALAELHALPIFYCHSHVAGGPKLTVQDVGQILRLPEVVGIKETTTDLREVRAHMQMVQGQDKAFFTGSATNLTQFLELGGHGAMCPEAVLMPDTVVQVYRAHRGGQKEAALAVQKTLAVLDPLVGSHRGGILRTVFMADEEVQPQAKMKAALSVLGVPTSPMVKAPLPPLSAADQHCVSQSVWKVRCTDWRDIMRPYPPIPRQRTCRQLEDTGGIILKTGAIQLGRDVGKDMTGWQGDGKAGFWD